nr:hypothetical protein [uncultured Pseudomonas sp.]
MNTKRLELALEQLDSSGWGHFERIASVFLASEFDALRTVASASGDGGRDSELFSPVNEPKVVAQYSVAQDWQAKVNHTVRRLNKTFPEVSILIYVSNQVIGADADGLKKNLRVKHGIALDIRDRNWFAERMNASMQNQTAAEELATVIVDPFLAARGVALAVPQKLSSNESIAALTFLGLQWQDDVREKGLTKLAFEALVRSALIGTSTEQRITKEELYARVGKVLPGHKPEVLSGHVDSAVRRLGKSAVKAWAGEEYCLSYQEVLRFKEYQAANALAEAEVMAAVSGISARLLVMHKGPADIESELAARLRAVIEIVLFDRSQAFAMAVQTGNLSALADTDFKAAILNSIAQSALPKVKGLDWLAVYQMGVKDLLISEVPAIQNYLRRLADSYTLMAFLQQTPDVQSAVEKMFSHGSLWLDTTVLLPLIGDTLFAEDESKGRFSRMIDAARDAGLKMFVTGGVLEEVERHMNRSLVCARMPIQQWEGAIPYLLEQYLSSGRSRDSFEGWLNTFRGDSRPIEDLADYVREEFGIGFRDLEAESQSAPADLRGALQQIWLERYERRKARYGMHLDDMAISRLISHDIECYAGVVHLRSQEKDSPFGYSAWWLTVDQVTFDLENRLRTMMTTAPPKSPVMSADFLVNYLAVGPLRNKVGKAAESKLPVMMFLGNVSQLTPELIEEAGALRTQLAALPERIIRREVRDGLDRAKARIGPIAAQGMETLVASIEI